MKLSVLFESFLTHSPLAMLLLTLLYLCETAVTLQWSHFQAHRRAVLCFETETRAGCRCLSSINLNRLWGLRLATGPAPNSYHLSNLKERMRKNADRGRSENAAAFSTTDIQSAECFQNLTFGYTSDTVSLTRSCILEYSRGLQVRNNKPSQRTILSTSFLRPFPPLIQIKTPAPITFARSGGRGHRRCGNVQKP